MTARPAMPVLLWLLLGFNVLFLCINGVFMLIAPKTWYDLVPGVAATGFFNQHFVRDIGLIQFFLGAAFVAGVWRQALRMALWSAATLWLAGHALFHVWEVAAGICAPSALLRDFPAVSLPALIGLVLIAWARRQPTP
jgi:hypothetical protein